MERDPYFLIGNEQAPSCSPLTTIQLWRCIRIIFKVPQTGATIEPSFLDTRDKVDSDDENPI